MPLPATLIGATTEPITHAVDSRWLMAYAACIGTTDACYLDTRRDGGVVGHPVFPVCLEWPSVLAIGARLAGAGLTSAEAARAVHHTHDLTIHRLLRPGDQVSTTARLARLEPHRSGAMATIELVTVDEAGQPVATTRMGTLYRGTAIDGSGDSDGSGAPGRDDPDERLPRLAFRVPIAANAAHVYTEGSRIWNPIHTDLRTAERAGLPGIILHGTATLAIAVSGVVSQEAGGRPQRIRRITARFAGMVTIPSEIEVRILDRTALELDDGSGPDGDLVTFEVRGAEGRTVLSHGAAVVAGP